MSALTIDCDWIEPSGAPGEVAVTASLLKIQVGDAILTRAKSDFSRSVANHAVLSAYPLALWLVGSWWRLRWESAPTTKPSLAWRMAHELPAAGFGFVWPSISFESIDSAIRVVAKTTKSTSFEPVQYLARGDYWLPAEDFERSVRQFVDLVCERLIESGIRSSPLQLLWDEVRSELDDEALSQVRRMEAMLGFDVGEAPYPLIDVFDRMVAITGSSARDEIAHALAGATKIEESVEKLMALEEKASTIGTFVPLNLDVPLEDERLPWERGYALARQVRRLVRDAGGPISNAELGNFLGLKASEIAGGQALRGTKVGIAVREAVKAKFGFRKAYGPRRRFEAARLLADNLIAPKVDRWLVDTDARSSRQQAQRAFAAEFLAPISSLVDFLSDDYSEEKIEEAADHFDVEEITIRQQLVNFRPDGMSHLGAY